jgi:hypothetical protein
MGLASRDGVFPMSHSQDITGPLARTVTDVAILLDATAGVDPADPVTKQGEGRAPKSYRDALKTDALKGARIGVLRNLFGTAPEDNEAGTVVRRALDELKKQGAEVVDVAIPDYDSIMAGTSLIDAEFKADINEYLSRVPDAPVRTLGGAIDGGLLHAAVDPASRTRNAIKAADADTAQGVKVKREAVRRIVTAAFDEHRLDAMAYPTMRRKPSRIGDGQPGSTCLLSAVSGLPALSVPAGITNDGLPIGLELLGRAFDESKLLALAYSYEQASHPRRAPFSAPALVNGRAPVPLTFKARVAVANEKAGAVVSADFTFDPTTGELKYNAAVSGVPADRIFGAWIQRGGAGEKGPAVYPVLARREAHASGTIVILPAEHARLKAGGFYVAIYTRGSPLGQARAQLMLR